MEKNSIYSGQVLVTKDSKTNKYVFLKHGFGNLKYFDGSMYEGDFRED